MKPIAERSRERVVGNVTSPERRNFEERLLVGELAHRMNNEFAAAIAVVSLAAARSTYGEVKSALTTVAERLHSYVQVNRHLQVPSQDAIIDASAHLRQLCESISRSMLDCKGIKLQFVGGPLEMNSERCWRLGMIISELVTDAARHAFGDAGGKIKIKLSRCGPFINCRLAVDGAAPEKIRPGRGSAIVEGLIASLHGTINRHFGPEGSVSDMNFPVCYQAHRAGPSALLPPESRETVLRVGPLELHLIERTAQRRNRAIHLLPREFRLLAYMMRRKEQVLTRALLLEEVWNYKFIPRTNLVDVYLGRLRRKVDEPHELPMIHNVRGMGFILRAPLAGRPPSAAGLCSAPRCCSASSIGRRPPT
jgi:two-component sensor histidine kinase/DNA-binding winged helix-turn-helix (wHTH) protein